MEFMISEAAVPRVAKALCDAIDAAGKPGRVELYDGRGEGASKLATLRFAQPCGEVAGAEVTFRFEDERSASGRGRARWARAFDGDGNEVFCFDVGERTAKSKPTLVLDDENVRPGDAIRVKQFTLTLVQTQAKG